MHLRGLKTIRKLKQRSNSKSAAPGWTQISFAKEDLAKLPPVSDKRKAYIEQITREALAHVRAKSAVQSHTVGLAATSKSPFELIKRALKSLLD